MPSVHLSGEHNITYVQIPKNAGTSIGHWIKNHSKAIDRTMWYNHPTVNDISRICNITFSFTVVRNPWERLVSMYFFAKNYTPPNSNYKDATDFSKMLLDINGYQTFPEFDRWVKNAKNFKFFPWIWWNVTTLQTTWSDVDLVLRYENLDSEFTQIQDMFNCYDPLQKEIVTNGIHWHQYRDLYNDETKRLVHKMYEEDIDRWKYTF